MGQKERIGDQATCFRAARQYYDQLDKHWPGAEPGVAAAVEFPTKQPSPQCQKQCGLRKLTRGRQSYRGQQVACFPRGSPWPSREHQWKGARFRNRLQLGPDWWCQVMGTLPPDSLTTKLTNNRCAAADPSWIAAASHRLARKIRSLIRNASTVTPDLPKQGSNCQPNVYFRT